MLTVQHAAVVGSPVGHSMSPALHTAAYEALGFEDWRYETVELSSEGGLAEFLRSRDSSWRGLSVTMPLKEAAYRLARQRSLAAEATGAVNTLVCHDAAWHGHNTDVAGLREVFATHAPDAVTAVILGGGATARSALAAMVGHGIREVVFAVRSPQRAAPLTDVAGQLGAHARIVPLREWPLVQAPLIVSTLPAAAASVAAAADGVRDSGTFVDVVYSPWPTALSARAQAQGMSVVSGIEMLVHQAAAQVELFTGHRPPLEPMWVAAGVQR